MKDSRQRDNKVIGGMSERNEENKKKSEMEKK